MSHHDARPCVYHPPGSTTGLSDEVGATHNAGSRTADPYANLCLPSLESDRTSPQICVPSREGSAASGALNVLANAA